MKVIRSEDNLVIFDNGLEVHGDGEKDCCAYNYLDFEQFPEGTELNDMSIGEFVDAISIKEDGFSVKDKMGIPKWVQARSSQNGYYSAMTTLKIKQGDVLVTCSEFMGVISD